MVCDLGSPLRSWENEEEPTKNIENKQWLFIFSGFLFVCFSKKTDEENQENRES